MKKLTIAISLGLTAALPGATEPPLTRPFMSINEIKAKYPCLATKTCTVKQNDEITAAINTGLAWLRARAGAIGAKEGALGAKKSQTHRTPPKTQSGSRLDRSGI